MNQKIIFASLLALFSSLHLPEANASGAIVWACTSPDISSQYLPSSCSSTGSSPTPAPPTPNPTASPPPPPPPPAEGGGGSMCPPWCNGQYIGS
ncbi:hypothetical protein [Aquella oligotrophica]|uniref:Uncharacterized protein n=1 Tax=Aquella oligotrophica TaxID=2067065 RepID=A0A2I7N8J7_9NEIS|nr:hypothetical protein [Aquella oligotrophica]AUR52779.1 hypothetical protein CUN60_10910 [Aquella oligotrophica]